MVCDILCVLLKEWARQRGIGYCYDGKFVATLCKSKVVLPTIA